MPKFPVLILIPHGGIQTPEEFAEISNPDSIDRIFSSDAGANELFGLESCAVMSTNILPLYADLDCSPLEIPSSNIRGVIKTKTALGEDVFYNNIMPDYIAITGILKRYYFPFYQTIKKILETGEIKIIMECHTVEAVGTIHDEDTDIPRPLVSIQNKIITSAGEKESCPARIASEIISHLKKTLGGEKHALKDPFAISETPIKGNLSREFSRDVPYLRLNISRALFINEEHFNHEFAKIDSIRLAFLKHRIEEGLTRFFAREYNG